jgi:hypothetical protein
LRLIIVCERLGVAEGPHCSWEELRKKEGVMVSVMMEEIVWPRISAKESRIKEGLGLK